MRSRLDTFRCLLVGGNPVVVDSGSSQIDIDFIRWCIKTEEKRGFNDEESRKEILGRYHAKKKLVEQSQIR